MKVAVFHPGTQHSWQTATALQDLGLLEFYATSIFYMPDRWPYRIERWLPGKLAEKAHGEFRRYRHDALDPKFVKTFGLFEWLERIAVRSGMGSASKWLNEHGNRSFADHLDKEVRSHRPFALWGYNSSSLEAFEAGTRAGRFAVLDRTIGDWRYYNEAMGRVRETHARWFHLDRASISAGQIAREDEEYAAADAILCGSEYCAQTIRKYSPVPGVADKLKVLPYCFDEALFANVPPPAPVDRSGPVRFLFVGQLGMRKGIHHVLEAISRIPRSEAELTLVGHMMIAPEVFARYQDRVTYLPTVPRSDIPAIMARHHAMVFPSYFEGSSLSLLEGLASGLALIHTPQAGNGVTPDTGILLERPDSDLTEAAMRALIDDRDRLDHCRAHAQAEAQNYSFARYRAGIHAFLAESGLLGPSGPRG